MIKYGMSVTKSYCREVCFKEICFFNYFEMTEMFIRSYYLNLNIIIKYFCFWCPTRNNYLIPGVSGGFLWNFSISRDHLLAGPFVIKLVYLVSGDNDVVLFHLSWWDTIRKGEKVSNYNVTGCSLNDLKSQKSTADLSKAFDDGGCMKNFCW